MNETAKLDKSIRALTMLMALLLLIMGALLLTRDHWKAELQAAASKEVVEAIKSGNTVISLTTLPPEIEGEEDDLEVLQGLEEVYGHSLLEDVPEATDRLIGMATLEIKKIDLLLPVVEGTGRIQLRYGAGWLVTSALPGQPGNCVIFGHRMRAKGRKFNRLDELLSGDEVIIADAEGTVYTYIVNETVEVEPADLFKELYKGAEGRNLSLVTCTPVGVGSRRMVVSCELEQ